MISKTARAYLTPAINLAVLRDSARVLGSDGDVHDVEHAIAVLSDGVNHSHHGNWCRVVVAPVGTAELIGPIASPTIRCAFIPDDGARMLIASRYLQSSRQPDDLNRNRRAHDSIIAQAAFETTAPTSDPAFRRDGARMLIANRNRSDLVAAFVAARKLTGCRLTRSTRG
jgi:hypothetical protein